MNPLIKEAIEYAKNDDFYKVLDCSKKMNPYDFEEFQKKLFSMKENPDFIDKMGNELSYEEMHLFFELGSSERMAKYINEKAEKGVFTEKDDYNLKACDF